MTNTEHFDFVMNGGDNLRALKVHELHVMWFRQIPLVDNKIKLKINHKLAREVRNNYHLRFFLTSFRGMIWHGSHRFFVSE